MNHYIFNVKHVKQKMVILAKFIGRVNYIGDDFATITLKKIIPSNDDSYIEAEIDHGKIKEYKLKVDDEFECKVVKNVKGKTYLKFKKLKPKKISKKRIREIIKSLEDIEFDV